MTILSSNPKNNQPSPNQFDSKQHQAITQLLAIGYAVGDRVTGRCLPLAESEYAINWTATLGENNLDIYRLKYRRDKEEWYPADHHPDGLSWLQSINSQQYGIYFNVNGGRNNAEVDAVKASIFECDTGSLDEQRERIANYPIRPTLTIYTGGKSIHTYYAIDSRDRANKGDWKETQQHLTLATKSDPAIKDLTRLFRLAGFKHQKSGNVATIEIINPVAYRLDHIQKTFNGVVPYSSDRYNLYQYLVRLQASRDRDYGVDASKAYLVAESELTVELARYKQYRQKFDDAFKSGESLEDASKWLAVPQSTIRKKQKTAAKRHKEINAKLSLIENQTIYPSVFPTFAEKYASHFNANGRAGFVTCKCPVHNGTSHDSLHIATNSDFLKCHSGCDPNEIRQYFRDRAIEDNHELADRKFQADNNGATSKSRKNYSKSEIKNQYSNLTQLTNVSLQVNHSPYLKISLVDIPPQAQLIGLKSAKGTGKSKLFEEVAKTLSRETKGLAITHRTQLGWQLSDLLNLWFIDSTNFKNFSRGKVLTIDSLHEFGKGHFDPDDPRWVGATLFLDEAEQVIWHLLNSATIGKKGLRNVILSNFAKVIKNIVSSGGKIFIADADLTDISINFIEGIAGKLNKFIVNNTAQPRLGKRKAIIYDHGSDLIESLDKSLEVGNKIYCHTGSQGEEKTWSTNTLESLFSEKYSKLNILRSDRDSVANPDHPSFKITENISSKVINFDAIFASPVLETGVSIKPDKPHFDSVYGISWGVQTPESFCQSIERVRADVDRHIWVREVGLTFVGNQSTNWKNLLADTEERANSLIKTLLTSGIDQDDDSDDFPDSYIFLKTWAKMGARVNCGRCLYRDIVIQKLESEGYVISLAATLDKVARKDINNMLVDCRDRNNEAKCKAVAETANPTDKEFEALNNQTSANTEDQQKLKHGSLVRKYCLEVTPDLVKKDQANWGQQLKLYYYLTTGASFLAVRDKRSLEKHFKKGKGIFAPDVLEECITGVVEVLKEFDIDQFLVGGAKFNNSSLSAWFGRINQIDDFYQKTKIKIDKDKTKPITVARNLISNLGLKFERTSQITVEGKRHWEYEVTGFEDGRENVLTAWYERDTAKNAEDAAQKDLHINPIYIYSNNKKNVQQTPTEENAKKLEDFFSELSVGVILDPVAISMDVFRSQIAAPMIRAWLSNHHQVEVDDFKDYRYSPF
jgi:hypothetical protein